MATVVPAKKGTAYIFYIGLASQADPRVLQANPTIAAGDVKVATDDGAPGNLVTLPVFDADFTKRVKVSLSAGEMNGDNITMIFSDIAGAEWCDLIVNIQTVANQIDDLDTTLDIIAVDVAGLDGSVMRGTDAAALASVCTETRLGELDAANIPTDIANVKTDTTAILLDTGTDGVVLKAAGLAADAVDEILDEVIEGAVTLRQAMRLALSILTGKSSGGGTATLVFRDIGDTKDRLSVTVDANGNRTAVGTRDGT